MYICIYVQRQAESSRAKLRRLGPGSTFPRYWLRRIRCSECPHTVHMWCRGLYPDPEAFIYPYMSRTILWMSRTVSRQSQGKNVVILQFSNCYRSQTVTPTVTYGRYIIIHAPNCNMVLYDGCIVPYCADTVRDPHPPDVQITVHFQIQLERNFE